HRPALPAAVPVGWHGPGTARPPHAAPGRDPPWPRGTRQRADETPGRGRASDTGTGGDRRRRGGGHAEDRSARDSWSVAGRSSIDHQRRRRSARCGAAGAGQDHPGGRRLSSTAAYTAPTATPVRLRVIEPFRPLFYTPQFVAIHGGHLAAEGLEIALTTATQGGGTVDALRSGSADLALGGLMRSFELVDRGGPRLVHFAAVN